MMSIPPSGFPSFLLSPSAARTALIIRTVGVTYESYNQTTALYPYALVGCLQLIESVSVCAVIRLQKLPSSGTESSGRV